MKIIKSFFKENDFEEKEISSPFEYMYIKILRFGLKTINSWPTKELGEHQSSFISTLTLMIATVFPLINFVGILLYIILCSSQLTFMDLGSEYIIMFICIVALSRLLTLTFSFKYRDVAKVFLTQIHLFYFKNNSEYSMKTHKRIHRISQLFSLYFIMQLLFSFILYHVIPVYNYFSSGLHMETGTRNLTFEISSYILYPYLTYSSTKEYLALYLFTCVSAMLAGFWFCTFDLFLSHMVFHTWGHLKILLNKLSTFPKPNHQPDKRLVSCEKYSENELLTINEYLKDCIDYHKLIVGFTKKISDAFGAMLLVYYTFHQISGCLLLLECTQKTNGAMIRYLPLTLQLNQQLIQLSVIFELIGSTSEKLKDGVYGLPWELMDVKNRKTVLIFLMNVQEPIHLKALGIANVGVTTMATVLKTSLSYFTFLRSI